MALKSNEAKYQVAVAQKHRWMPGHTIETFELVVPKTRTLTVYVLQEEAKKAGVQGKVIGTLLIERGKSVKKQPAQAIKVDTK